jgi:hypothetical protein
MNLAIYMVIMDMCRCAEEEPLPKWIMGRNPQEFINQTQSRKGDPSCCVQDRHHLAQVE